MPVPTIKLSETADLQADVERLWSQGETVIGLEGAYSPPDEGYAVLRITRELSGIAFLGVGSGASLEGAGKTSHVVVIDGANVTMRGIGIFGGNTTDPATVARSYKGPHWRSIYEAMDGAGMLITGNSKVDLEYVTFGHNHSGMCGGGLSNQGTGPVTANHCTFTGNTAYHTGAAIDNLTPGSRLMVHKSHFENNRSNAGSICGGPHGQVTVFPRTQAIIRHSRFVGGSLAIDAADGSDVRAYDNRQDGRLAEPIEPARAGSPIDRARHFGRIVAYGLPLLVRHGLYPMVRKS